MWHDGHLRMQPKRTVLRQRLRPEGVERRIRQLPRIERAYEVPIDDVLAAPDIYQHRPFGHHGERFSAENPLGLSRQRQQTDGNIGLIEEWFELLLTMVDGNLAGRSRSPYPSRNLELE